MYSLIILFPPQKKSQKSWLIIPVAKWVHWILTKHINISYGQGPEIIQKYLDIQANCLLNVRLRLTWQEVFQKTSGLFWTIRSSLSVNDSVPPAAPGTDRSDYHSAVFPCPWLFLSDAARASVAFSGTWAPCSSSKARSLSYDDLVTCRPHGYLPGCRVAYLHASLRQTTRRVPSFPISLL